MAQRGQQGAIIYWILVIIALIILLLVVLQAKKLLFDKPFHKAECASQVLASSQLTRLGKGEIAAPITCPTKDEPVPAKASDEEIKARLASDMKECWDTWGRGQYLLFDQDGVYCHICSHVTFEDKTKTIQGFNQYLVDTTVPGHEITYIDYFNPNYESEQFAGTALKIDKSKYANVRDADAFSNSGVAVWGGTFVTSKDYGVLFYYARGEEQINLVITELSKDTIDKTAGGAKGLVIGGVVGVGAATIACGVFTLGTCWVVAGAAGAIAGTTGLLIGVFTADNPPQYAPFVLVRELDETAIKQLDCTNSAAKRKA